MTAEGTHDHSASVKPARGPLGCCHDMQRHDAADCRAAAASGLLTSHIAWKAPSSYPGVKDRTRPALLPRARRPGGPGSSRIPRQNSGKPEVCGNAQVRFSDRYVLQCLWARTLRPICACGWPAGWNLLHFTPPASQKPGISFRRLGTRLMPQLPAAMGPPSPGGGRRQLAAGANWCRQHCKLCCPMLCNGGLLQLQHEC